MVAAAAGDALGAPYEFQGPIAASEDVGMIGGGVLDWGEAEWTDDTSMAIVVLEAAASTPGTHDLRTLSALDQIAREWYSWSMGTPDIGALTSTVMRRAADGAREAGRSLPHAVDLQEAAASANRELPLVAGNAALMRAHASVLPYLHASDDDTEDGIRTLCMLTHVHPDALEACVLWGFAVRHAILTGEIDVRIALDRLPEDRRAVWRERIEDAEQASPAEFPRNGWVVAAFQAAWAAVHRVMPLPEDRFARREALVAALSSAVRAGYDTDTVACITGALIGAALGPKAVPPEWRRELFGWPGYEVAELENLVERVVRPAPVSAGTAPIEIPTRKPE
ncbi:ADP-ribosylglycohydrolase [Brachybacterium endophyticum]|uniref:ADP-ribosylglycohydrolase n=1 Tax=Brachybacterium endophyticum TaxID=2182385 RepID=A0A2U2RMS0_9MICO|nr:ADP-ribosylglycohydrolase [Brachybacterium endophyticum]